MLYSLVMTAAVRTAITVVMMVIAAAVLTATAIMMVMVLSVVVALYMGIEIQLSCQECFHSRVRIAGNTAIQLNVSRCQGHLGAAANTTADQNLRVQRVQNTCQRAVAAAVGIHHLGRNDLALSHIIDFELLGVAKVLEDLTVFISYRDSHER